MNTPSNPLRLRDTATELNNIAVCFHHSNATHGVAAAVYTEALQAMQQHKKYTDSTEGVEASFEIRKEWHKRLLARSNLAGIYINSSEGKDPQHSDLPGGTPIVPIVFPTGEDQHHTDNGVFSVLLHNLGLIRLHLGQMTEAADLMERALSLLQSPQNENEIRAFLSMHCVLGEVYGRQGRLENATEELLILIQTAHQNSNNAISSLIESAAHYLGSVLSSLTQSEIDEDDRALFEEFVMSFEEEDDIESYDESLVTIDGNDETLAIFDNENAASPAA